VLDLGLHLRRLMAQQDLTLRDVVQRTGLNPRTVQRILAGRSSRPHARTLHRLARGLGVGAETFFRDGGTPSARSFDLQTNPAVSQLLASQPELFAHWQAEDFDELYSHFGTGGGLTRDGALRVAQQICRRQQVQAQVAVILQTDQAELLAALVEVLYRRALVEPADPDVQPAADPSQREPARSA
jgi:transcriptional regulator with XRE-family HTH domain